MATIVGYTQVQYSGIWSLSGQANAKANSTWPVPPVVGTLWSWGNGQGVGNGTTTAYSSPVQIGALSTWKVIAGQNNGGLAINLYNQLWSWGSNGVGQLGNGSTYNESSPVQIGSLATWSTLGSSDTSVIGLKTDGTIWTWGYNVTYGTLGLGNTTNRSSPVQVGALTNWATTCVARYHMLAVKTDGTLWAWGANAQGQLGLGNTTNYSSPMQIGALTTWSKVSGGSSFSMAIKTDGTLWSWGGGAYGALGLGNTTYYSSPKQIGGLTDWLAISCGSYATFALKTNGTLWSWGYNQWGSLGQGNTTNYSSPKQIGALTSWSQLPLTNRRQGCSVIKTDGTLWAWGYNANGQLGTGNTTNYSSPKQIGVATNWLKVANGYSNTFALRG